jgi:transposase
MRTGISITLKPADRRRLKVLAQDRNTPHKHVWRAEIVLLSADGVGTNEIMRRTGKSKTCVWRWQERFMEAGYDSLLHDKTRPSRIPPLASGITERVVTLAQTAPPTEATHWTSAMMAKVVGISEFRPTHLARARPAAAPGETVQTLHRPALRRQAARRRRSLCRSARPCRRPLGR